VTVIDARSPESWKNSDVEIPGSVRVPPDEVQQHLSEIPRDRRAVSYCT
jgi:rhodanese-related sulfurtransferase